MTLYLNPMAPWSEAGRNALFVRYGMQRHPSPREALHDLSPWPGARFHTQEPAGEREHDAPALASAVVLLGVHESALALCQEMSAISEEGICAGWESGLENDLWRYAEDDAVEHPFARLMGGDEDDRDLLRRLRDEGGVWWVYDGLGNRAVPVEEFRAAFAEHGRWPGTAPSGSGATAANILEDGWDRGLHAFETGATCPCDDCRTPRPEVDPPSVTVHSMGAMLSCDACSDRYELDRVIAPEDEGDGGDAVPSEDDRSLCDRLYDNASHEGWVCGLGECTICPACRRPAREVRVER